jgi:NADPH:quinone reductase-like Zn-dependent oxidoreductase
VTEETGGTFGWGMFNCMLAAGMLREAAAQAYWVTGEVIPSDVPGKLAMAVRQPVGVVVGIAPWNGPVILATRAVATPLAYGNTVVLKASELCPRTHAAVAHALQDAGLPDGVVNFLTNAPEDAADVVDELIVHPATRRINFTGSTRVGRIIAEKAGRHLKPVARIPDHVTFEQAACMGVSYPMAWNLLEDVGGVQPGDDVLVMAAGGGLGVAGTLVAKALGARVIAAAGAAWKLERCTRELGADAAVDYSQPGWPERVHELSSDGRGVAVVFENISSPELFAGALAALRPRGRLVTCGAHGGGTIELDVRALYRGHLTIAGSTGATAQQTREVFAAVAEGRLAPPPVGARFALRDVASAQEAAAGRDLFGRAVLEVGA